jgi:hypothetical protein
VVREQPSGALSLVTVGGSALASPQIMRLDVPSVSLLLASGPGDWVALKAGSDVQVDKGYLSEPQVGPAAGLPAAALLGLAGPCWGAALPVCCCTCWHVLTGMPG